MRMQKESVVHKEYVRNHVITDISEEEKCVLSFSILEANNVLHWEKPDEFEYKGEMYDVISMKQMNDSVIYVCYHDKKESGQKESYAQLLINSFGNDLQKEQQSRIKIFFNVLYLPAGISDLPATFESTAQTRSTTRELLNKFRQKPPVPPPKSLS
jgi:hypothetical protein